MLSKLSFIDERPVAGSAMRLVAAPAVLVAAHARPPATGLQNSRDSPGHRAKRLGILPVSDRTKPGSLRPKQRKNPRKCGFPGVWRRRPICTRYPVGESNPCYRPENPASWATRRTGRSGTVQCNASGKCDHPNSSVSCVLR